MKIQKIKVFAAIDVTEKQPIAVKRTQASQNRRFPK